MSKKNRHHGQLQVVKQPDVKQNIFKTNAIKLYTVVKTRTMNIVRMVYRVIEKIKMYMIFTTDVAIYGIKNFFSLSIDARIKQVKNFAKREYAHFRNNKLFYAVLFLVVFGLAWLEGSSALITQTVIILLLTLVFDFVLFNAAS